MSAAQILACPVCAGSGQLSEGLCDDCDSTGLARCTGPAKGRRCKGYGVEGEHSTDEQPLCLDCQSEASDREREKAVRRVA